MFQGLTTFQSDIGNHPPLLDANGHLGTNSLNALQLASVSCVHHAHYVFSVLDITK